jgi:hypothetical protein
MNRMKEKLDARTGRKQSISLSQGFQALTLHKSIWFREKQISIPIDYWQRIKTELGPNPDGWNHIKIIYHSPRVLQKKTDGTSNWNKGPSFVFKGSLKPSKSKNRDVDSSWRLKWEDSLSEQLANDYPFSMVRACEYELGESDKKYYSKRGFSELDIGGTIEQVQYKFSFDSNASTPTCEIKELYKRKDLTLDTPLVFKKFWPIIFQTIEDNDSDIEYFGANWKNRNQLASEVKENIIYILADDDNGFYIGETKGSLKARYGLFEEHDTGINWTKYKILPLPFGTPDVLRKTLESALIHIMSILMPTNIKSPDLSETKPIYGLEASYLLFNRKK